MRSAYITTTAKAIIKGSSKYPNLHGIANFKQMKNGVLVKIEVLPTCLDKLVLQFSLTGTPTICICGECSSK